MPSHELDRTGTHVVTYHENDPNSDRVLLCFGFDGTGNMGSRGFGSDFCDRNGWNHVYLGPSKRGYFRDLPVDRLREMLDPHISGRDVITYGASLGGFAALFYGSHLDARILAASPRHPGHRLLSTAPFSKLDAPLNGQLSDAPRASRQPLVVYDDGQRKDRIMVRDWVRPAYPDARIIHIPNAGHHALDRLKSAGVLSRFIRSFVETGEVEVKESYFPPETLEWQRDMARVLEQRGEWKASRDMLWQAIHAQPENAPRLMPMLIAATAASPAAEVSDYIAGAVERGEIQPADYKPAVRGRLQRVLKDARATAGAL